MNNGRVQPTAPASDWRLEFGRGRGLGRGFSNRSSSIQHRVSFLSGTETETGTSRGVILTAMDQEVACGQGDRHFLLVRSGGVFCALPANEVRRVVRGLTCHPVPGGQPHLLGLAHYGGEPLAVLDILALVSGDAPRANNRATVILGREKRGTRTVLGLAVDEALRVASMTEFSDVEAGGSGLLQGTATLGKGAVKLLNTSVLFADKWRPMEESHA